MIGRPGSVWLSHLAQAWAYILCSYGLYKCTADSLGIDKMSKLVKMKKLLKMMKLMKKMKMIKLVMMSLRIVSGSLGELKQVLGYQGALVSLGYPEQGSALDYQDTQP